VLEINRRNLSTPGLALFLAMLIWGSSFVVMKVALMSFDPLLVIFGRLAVAALIVFLLRSRFGEIRYKRGDWKLLIFMAICEPCMYFVFEGYALRFTSASEAGTITALLPLMSIVAARFVLREKVSAKIMLGLFVALVGAVGLTLGGRPAAQSPNPTLGNLLELLAMVFAAGYSTATRRLSERYSPFFLTAIQAFVGTLFFMPVLFMPSVRIASKPGWLAVLSVVYLGAGVSVAAYFLYNYGLKRIPVSRVAPYLNLIPLFSIMLGWMMLDDHLAAVQYVSAILVITGTFVSQSGSKVTERVVALKWLKRAGRDATALQ
jgi:drug/metabolite transporter (DMT)-like permease